MLPEQKNTNITPIKTNNESSLKYSTYPEVEQKTPSAAFKFCQSLSDINTQNEKGWTPIYQSIISNDLNALYDLLKLGANPDIPNNLGETPLYLSVDNKNYDALIILLQYNANCNIPKKNGNTPLHLATKNNLDIFMSALLRNNADPNIVNKLYSQTPTHLAIINKVDENTLIEFNMSKADIYNFKDKYDKSPFDYAVDSGDQNYTNLLKKIFGEDNNILNGSNNPKNGKTEKLREINSNGTPVNANNEYKNNTNFDNRKLLFSFEENYLNKNNSSVIIKSIENKNLLFNDDTETKNKKKEDENLESVEIDSSEEKNKFNINTNNQEINEDIKLNGKSQEKKEENKNNSTDTIQKLSLSNNGDIKSQFKIDRNSNYTISNNQNQNQENKDINNTTNEINNKNSINNLKKNNSNNNSINQKNNKKDISEMNPLDMINQVITTSSNVFSELQMNSNTIKNNQSDEYFNNKSGRENMSNLNNLMINDSLEYSKSNTHLISDISTKRNNNDKTKSSNDYNDISNFNGLNITINEYEDNYKNNNNSNIKKSIKNKQLSYHKQNINENKENLNTNSNEKRSSINSGNSSMINNNKKISKEGGTITNQNEIITQNSTSQGENIITKIKYYNSAQTSPENQKEMITKDSCIECDKNKFMKNCNINNNYKIKSLIDQQSTINTYSNNINNKSNKYPSLKLSEMDNNTNSYLLKNMNKSEELNLCSPQNIQNEVLTRLREWLISCDLLCYYNLLIKNEMYDINLYIKNLKNNKINISYKDIEDMGIKKPGHIFRFLLKLQIDTGILDEQMCNLIINKFSSNLLSTIGLTASTNIVKCCGMTLFKQNGDNNSSENKNMCCTMSDNDSSGNAYNDIFGFLKYKGLMEYKENFIHNGFDQIDYIFIQLFSNFKFNIEILNDYLHIYSEKDKTKVIKKLYEEKRKIALELGFPFDMKEEERILNTKNDINDENSSCNIF